MISNSARWRFFRALGHSYQLKVFKLSSMAAKYAASSSQPTKMGKWEINKREIQWPGSTNYRTEVSPIQLDTIIYLQRGMKLVLSLKEIQVHESTNDKIFQALSSKQNNYRKTTGPLSVNFLMGNHDPSFIKYSY
jgi:hypothetical protein